MALPRKTRLALGTAVVALALLVAGSIAWMLRWPDTTSAPTAAAPAGAAPAAAPAPAVYDPTKLLENGVAASEVWVEEPRSEAWAQAVEGAVGFAMGKDLDAMVPAAAVVLKCKTLSCLVGVDAPEDKREAALAVTKLVMLGPWMVDLEPEEDGTLRWLFFTEPRFGNPTAFVEWYRGLRKRALGEIRAGKTRNPLPVPATDVPQD